MNQPRKQEFYKTAKYNGEYVAILKAHRPPRENGNWCYTLRQLDGTIQAWVGEDELSDFCL